MYIGIAHHFPEIPVGNELLTLRSVKEELTGRALQRCAAHATIGPMSR